MPESDPETLERRLEAVERAVSNGDHPLEPESATPGLDGELPERVETLESRVDELDAALQAVRGFLGGVDAVNERVEARAEAAIAAVERLEQRLDERDGGVDEPSPDDGGSEPRTVVGGPDPAPESPDRSLGERLRDGW